MLDIGCGDGALMAALRDEQAASMRAGWSSIRPMSPRRWRAGCRCVQGDADTDLADYPDHSFDYAILSQTLQTTRSPHLVLDDLLRIGRQAFVSFPNFAHWRVRASLLWGGRMPVTRLLPERWYDTPNIHHVTIDDFRALVKERGITVEGAWFLNRPTNQRSRRQFPRRTRGVPAQSLIVSAAGDCGRSAASRLRQAR